MVTLFTLTLKLSRLCRVFENPCTVQMVKEFFHLFRLITTLARARQRTPFSLVLNSPLRLDLPGGLFHSELRTFNFMCISHSDLSHFITLEELLKLLVTRGVWSCLARPDVWCLNSLLCGTFRPMD